MALEIYLSSEDKMLGNTILSYDPFQRVNLQFFKISEKKIRSQMAATKLSVVLKKATLL